MVTAAQRRQAVGHLQKALGVSERRACRVLGQPRATQRQKPRAKEAEGRLVTRRLELVQQYPRYGYRRVWALLRREGWRGQPQACPPALEAAGAESPQETAEEAAAGVERQPLRAAAGGA